MSFLGVGVLDNQKVNSLVQRQISKISCPIVSLSHCLTVSLIFNQLQGINETVKPFLLGSQVILGYSNYVRELTNPQ